MTTSSTDSDSPDAASQSPTRQAAESEAGLRRVLAYICARRRRRLFAGAIVFLLLFLAIDVLISFPLTLLNSLVPVFVGYDLFFKTIYGSPVILGLWTLATYLLPLIITLVIFSRLRRVYRGY